MTEKERMLAGKTYNSRDPELIEDYAKARKLLAKLNSTSTIDSKKRRNILERLFGQIGDNCWVESPFYCDYGLQIKLGKRIFINYNCVFLDSNIISIGDDSLIGPAVQIYTATHPLKASERILEESTTKNSSYITSSKPVSLGKKNWIGGGAKILPGVTIGDNTTIGAGSVVTKSVPGNVFAAGNPCKVIKHL